MITPDDQWLNNYINNMLLLLEVPAMDAGKWSKVALWK